MRNKKKKALSWLIGHTQVDRLTAVIGLALYFILLLIIGL